MLSDGTFKSCCRKGRVKLSKPTDINGNTLDYPEFLQDLLTNSDNPAHKNFRENIRPYNSSVSFSSLGAKVDIVQGNGPYVFRVHGQIYHRTSHVYPTHGQAPQHAQLYVVDITQATEIRANYPANSRCLPEIIDEIDRYFLDT